MKLDKHAKDRLRSGLRDLQREEMLQIGRDAEAMMREVARESITERYGHLQDDMLVLQRYGYAHPVQAAHFRVWSPDSRLWSITFRVDVDNTRLIPGTGLRSPGSSETRETLDVRIGQDHPKHGEFVALDTYRTRYSEEQAAEREALEQAMRNTTSLNVLAWRMPRVQKLIERDAILREAFDGPRPGPNDEAKRATFCRSSVGREA